jgi:ribosome-associated protein
MSASPATVEPREDEVEFIAIRAQGAGGQNVNKVANAVHLRFDIASSSLPDEVKSRLRQLSDRRIGGDGVIVIKARAHRSLPRNRLDALARLRELIAQAALTPTPRRATQPSRAARARRVDSKVKRGAVKRQRSRAFDSDDR